ncbi:MAG: Serine/threonine protein kinase PrkC, regulator of stationary phase [Frankiales bacterium]|nr:Serine/threonine protein kinase PrkC, regulator of stationary phase [Frankiales bacterium]
MSLADRATRLTSSPTTPSSEQTTDRMNDMLGSLAGTPTPGVLIGGRYRVSGHIGRGSSAEVFAARDEVLNRAVALKVFRFDGRPGEDRRRVAAEVRLLSSFHHPGLVTVYDAGSLDEPTGADTPYLVMELVNGPTLSQQLEPGPLSAADTAQLANEVAAALGYIHGLGVVHRDIKPANIILGAGTSGDQPFAVKLTDFGIALMIDGTRLTIDGFTIGTANYLSPEQALGAEIGPASDIYSLGLVLIQCLTGELAFPGAGVEAAIARLHRQPAVPTRFGSEWASLLESMTEREPEARPTAVDVLQRLPRVIEVPPAHALAWSEEDTSTVAMEALLATPRLQPNSSHPAKPRPPRPGMKAVVAVVSVLLIALVVVGAVVDHGPRSQSPSLGTSLTPSPSSPAQTRAAAASSPSPTVRATPAMSSAPVSPSIPAPAPRPATKASASHQAPPGQAKKAIKKHGPKSKK